MAGGEAPYDSVELGCLSHFRGVDELLEANNEAAANDEMVGDPHVQPLAGRAVGCGVPGEHHNVLAVDDVGVVVGCPALPVLAEYFHDMGGDSFGSAVRAGKWEAGHLGPLDIGRQGCTQSVQVTSR